MRMTRQSSRSAARRAGYVKGWQDGYRIGASEAIARTAPLPAVAKRPVRVLFVREHSTGYDLIESGIIEALSKAVQELEVANNTDPLLDIVRRSQPDLMLVLNGIFSLTPDILEQIRLMGVTTAIWFADDPYFMNLSSALAVHVDHVFTHEAAVVAYYASLGARSVHYLPFAAHLARVHPKPVEPAYWTDICFIGSGFAHRLAFFNRLAPYLQKRKVFIAGGSWDRMRSYKKLKSSIRLSGVPADVAVNYYNGARIVINLHRQSDGAGGPLPLPPQSVNPRTFEINACAVLQLTDVRADLPKLYSPGHELATFTSAEECIAKLDYYLRHEDERRELALAGYRATRVSHTYEHRIDALLNIVLSTHGVRRGLSGQTLA